MKRRVKKDESVYVPTIHRLLCSRSRGHSRFVVRRSVVVMRILSGVVMGCGHSQCCPIEARIMACHTASGAQDWFC